MSASTITGNNASGTLAIGAAVSLGVTTFANGTATLTFTDATSLYIAGIPVASTNVAITNTATALWVDAGNVRFDGDILLPTSGSVINFASGNALITHSADLLTFSSQVTINGDFSLGNDVPIFRDVNAALTASTTQTQGNGALTADVNEVSVVANTNDTVTLPTAKAGRKVVIINNGANTLQIFPASDDNLGAGLNTATTLAAGSNVVYCAFDATNWESI